MGKSVVLIFIGLALFVTAFMVGVNAAGMGAMALAIMFAGYGAGLMMDSPCEHVKK